MTRMYAGWRRRACRASWNGEGLMMLSRAGVVSLAVVRSFQHALPGNEMLISKGPGEGTGWMQRLAL